VSTFKQFLRALKDCLGGKNLRQAHESDPRLKQSPMREGFGVGLINSEQISAYANALPTGLDDAKRQEGLTNWWGATDRESALETLGGLAYGNHTRIYAAALDQFLGRTPGTTAGPSENWRTGGLPPPIAEGAELAATQWAQEPPHERIAQTVDQIQRAYRELGDEKHGQYRPADYERGVAAWDLGRLVTVSRMCADQGLIGAAERDGIVAWAGASTAEQFATWDEVAVSYLIGRACLFGWDPSWRGLAAIAAQILDDAASPWTIPLRR
jgi:hypothetical protein